MQPHRKLTPGGKLRRSRDTWASAGPGTSKPPSGDSVPPRPSQAPPFPGPAPHGDAVPPRPSQAPPRPARGRRAAPAPPGPAPHGDALTPRPFQAPPRTGTPPRRPIGTLRVSGGAVSAEAPVSQQLPAA